MLAEFEDESYASYSYDAFGRRIYREEMSWKDLDGIGKGKEKSNNGKGKGNCKDQAPGNGKFNNPGQGKKIGLYKNSGENGNSHVYHKETTYLYEGLSTNLHKEYSATGSPYAEYYKGPNGKLTSRKMFGNHGLSNPAHDPVLKTTGGMLYYQYDGQRADSETTDRHGAIIERYRYDAFGGIFTGITSPYNHHGYTGMLYDGKTGLIDMNARWYDPNAGRFMTEDTYPGELMSPQSQNRYAYVMNNPVNMWDPTGHVSEYMDGGTYTGVDFPSWVRNYESHSEEETINNSTYYHIWTPSKSSPIVVPGGETQLVDVVDHKTFYRHYLQKQETTLWYYQYQKYWLQYEDIPKPLGDSKDITFKETVTKEWHVDISAKDIAKVNQEYIAGLEAPPNAVVKVERWMNGETLTQGLLSSHLSKHEGKESQGDSKNLFGGIGFNMKGLHMALDIAGMTPIGPIADAINAVIYLVEGDWVNAGLAVLSAVPIIGDVLGAAKIGAKYGDEALQLMDYLRGYLRETGLFSKLEEVYQSATAWLPFKKTKNVNNILKLDEMEVKFKRNAKHDPEEFARQIKNQEEAMNNLTVEDYLKNRERYINEGRSLEGNAAQQVARENAYLEKVSELRKSGLSLNEAEKEASAWIKTQAALHNPDQIAGGDPLKIGGMGDKRVNSSIGSQWKYRIDILDEQIRQMAKNMSDEELKNTYLNVKLTY